MQLAAFRDGRLPGQQLNWAIRNRNTMDCLGGLQANLKPQQQAVEIGYKVHTEHQNKGIATAALSLLVSELCASLPDHRLIAVIHGVNTRSERVLLKAKFTLVEGPTGPSGSHLFQYSAVADDAA